MKHSKYFRISLTDRCNLNCFYCHKEGASGIKEKLLTADEIELACKIAKSNGFVKFKLTGGEPTLREDIYEIINKLSKLDLPDLSMITNGVTLKTCAEELWAAGLRRLNVSLHTLDQNRFETIQYHSNSVKIEAITEGIKKAKEVGFENIKINFVYIDEKSDVDLNMLLDFVKEQGLILVILPMISEDVFCSLSYLYEKLKKIGISSEYEITDNEGIHKKMITMNSGAKVLLRKEELSECYPYTYCETCETRAICREGIYPIRLSAGGYLIPCMANTKHRIPIRDYLKNGQENKVTEAFEQIKRWNKNE